MRRLLLDVGLSGEDLFVAPDFGLAGVGGLDFSCEALFYV